MPKQTFGLGRGLSSLIPSRRAAVSEPKSNYFSATAFASRELDEAVARSAIIEVPLDSIVSNKYQPRQHFAEKPLQELAASIKAHGILQPLVVMRSPVGSGYELVAGERRLRAAKLAGLTEVPALVRAAGELERLELALIENIQRADLNPIEEAAAYQKLNDEFGLTHDEIAKRVGKSRSAISNVLRLLSLPTEMQAALASGEITAGHAKVLLEIKEADQRAALFKMVLRDKLTISDTAQEVKEVTVNRHQRRIFKDPNLEAYEARLRQRLGTKVSLRRRGKNGGVIVIEYYGEEELGELVTKLTRE